MTDMDQRETRLKVEIDLIGRTYSAIFTSIIGVFFSGLFYMLQGEIKPFVFCLIILGEIMAISFIYPYYKYMYNNLSNSASKEDA